MALKRSQITLSDAELQQFLEEERIVTCASLGHNGRPHLMPLWYVVDNGLVTAWTFGKSQKVRNLERLPQATLQVEAGRDRYAELRGAMLECDVEILRDPASVEAIGLALARRYGGLAPGVEVPEQARAGVLKQAPKRVGLRFRPTRVVSWDHRKLGGGY
jgi:PPOX class probable F420-dependent enzyme